MNTLLINNLSLTYPDGTKALDRVSLEIKNGLFGLLGPNGAGKSTLMRTIAALQEPDSGTIHFNGIDILKDPMFIRKQLGYLPQEFGVYPKISALHLLRHIATLKGLTTIAERDKQIDALLHQTNLWNHRNKSVSSFSGGMRQRFGIAQALLGNPNIVIVDEPTAGLDPEERNRFHNLLSEIGEQVIVILSTHIVEDVKNLCPGMAIMNAGHILAKGAPDDLIGQLQGQVWTKTIHKNELANYQHFNILSHRFYAGKIILHIKSVCAPEEGFLPVTPDLEDVYFSAITNFNLQPC